MCHLGYIYAIFSVKCVVITNFLLYPFMLSKHHFPQRLRIFSQISVENWSNWQPWASDSGNQIGSFSVYVCNIPAKLHWPFTQSILCEWPLYGWMQLSLYTREAYELDFWLDWSWYSNTLGWVDCSDSSHYWHLLHCKSLLEEASIPLKSYHNRIWYIVKPSIDPSENRHRYVSLNSMRAKFEWIVNNLVTNCISWSANSAQWFAKITNEAPQVISSNLFSFSF